MKRSLRNRRGLSLLEVILAMAILGMTLLSIGGLVHLGARQAVQAREMTTAQLLCEGKVAEITAGILPAEAGGPWPFDLPEHAGWVYYVDLQPLPQPGMLQMTVLVQENVQTWSYVDPRRVPREFMLVRWIKDPMLQLEPVDDGLMPADPTMTPTAGETSGF